MGTLDDIVDKVVHGTVLSQNETKYIVKELYKLKGEQSPNFDDSDQLLNEVFNCVRKAIPLFDSAKGNKEIKQQAIQMLRDALMMLGK